jgi:endonuclease/exonuclease/phosphatase family metal-dependent hydrolase
MNKSMKNDSLSMIKKLGNNTFNYLDFIKPLENDINKEIVYPLPEEIKKIGYEKYHTMFKNNIPYLYNQEDLKCNIHHSHKKYGNDFKLEEMSGLKIMTWNVHNWVQICTSYKNEGIKRKVEEFVTFIDKYKPDILCLQEVVPKNNEQINKNISEFNDLKKLNFKYIIELFESCGYKYNIIGNTNVDSTFEDDNTNYFYLANAIFSKIPIQKYYIFGIPYNRNIIIAKIMYNNKIVYIVNTHLEYILKSLSKKYSKYKIYQKLKNEERENGFSLNMNILLALLHKIKSKNIIVCGDFNHSYTGKYTLKRLELGKKIFIPFMNIYKDSTSYPNILYRATNLKNRQILSTDFIFLNKMSNLYVEKSYVIYSDLSDHYPVYTSFNWKS